MQEAGVAMYEQGDSGNGTGDAVEDEGEDVIEGEFSDA